MRTEWSRWARAAALGAMVVTGAGGCAAEKGMAPAPDVNAAQKSVVLEPEPATIEEAQAQLDRARAQLGGPGWAGGGAGGPGATSATTAPTTTAAPTVRMETPPPAASATGGDESQRRAACVTPCHAIASMRRAVEAICRMAGAQDARCTDARKTLGESEAKTAGCGC